MASLVADYDSSSRSDSENETSCRNSSEHEKKTQQNLLTSQVTSSSSDSDGEDRIKPPSSSASTRPSGKRRHDADHEDDEEDDGKQPLPLPGVLTGSGGGKNLPSLSVFANPFERARQEKLSILEKHVKLKEQEKPDGPNAKTNKKVCFKYQKGKCRFGDTCKFYHADSKQPAAILGQNQGAYPSASGSYFGAPLHEGLCFGDQEEIPDEEETVQKRRKERAGLSEALLPSKKALKIYDRQRMKDRPWTQKW